MAGTNQISYTFIISSIILINLNRFMFINAISYKISNLLINRQR